MTRAERCRIYRDRASLMGAVSFSDRRDRLFEPRWGAAEHDIEAACNAGEARIAAKQFRG